MISGIVLKLEQDDRKESRYKYFPHIQKLLPEAWYN